MTTREKMVELARAKVAERLTIHATVDAVYNEACALAVSALYGAGYDGANVTDVALEVAAVYATK